VNGTVGGIIMPAIYTLVQNLVGHGHAIVKSSFGIGPIVSLSINSIIFKYVGFCNMMLI